MAKTKKPIIGDAFGAALLDYHKSGHASPLILERDDGYIQPALPAAWFFTSPPNWDAYERRALELVQGRVLDIGCGAGRHALWLQERGHEVVAVDVSPHAVEVCRLRGVRDARVLDLAEIDNRLGTFDTVLMMCGNFGLNGTPLRTRRFLRRLHQVTAPDAAILADTVDSQTSMRPEALEYQRVNVARGRMPGQVTIRLRYRTLATPWFDLLTVSRAEMTEVAEGAGWIVDRWFDEKGEAYIGVLRKQARASPDASS